MERIITEVKSMNESAENKEITVNGCVISHRGCVRENNEDNFFFDGDLMLNDEVDDGAMVSASITKNWHLFAICDGMGGLMGGERASGIAVRSLKTLNRDLSKTNVSRMVDECANAASREVLQDSLETTESGKEGSTMALLYILNGKMHVANVGDSRIYLLRLGKLYQLSTDHSQLFRLMRKGQMTREQMRKHPQANVIGAYIGMAEEKKPNPYVEHFSGSLCAGDRFMLCSDGLSDLVTHEELQRRLTEAADPKKAATQLVWRALEMGGKDNVTCMVLDLSGESLPKATAASLSRFPQER